MNLNINPAFRPAGAYPMQSISEVVVATIPGAHDDQRLEVALCQSPGQANYLELRQQTWGDGIGWFTQSRVQLEPHQVADLRAVLGSGSVQGGKNTRTKLPKAFSQVAPSLFVPRVVHADSA